jgi:protein-S-isoprenylcysteine O-methyltransferase Ste14
VSVYPFSNSPGPCLFRIWWFSIHLPSWLLASLAGESPPAGHWVDKSSLGLQTSVLKETSYYQVTRNPQVLGCVLYVIGFIILWPTWFALGWGSSLIVILHVMVLTEEEHLHNTYGQRYEKYFNKVPRYLGYQK